VSTQEDLKAALTQTFGPWLRTKGFKGSSPTWRLTSELGDIAIVNVQSSMSSTSSDLRCTVNLAVAPEPWLSYERFRLSRPLKSPPESIGLFKQRLAAPEASGDANRWWIVRSSSDAETVVREVMTQLQATGLPQLNHLLIRSNFLRAIADGELGFFRRGGFDVYFEIADLVMHADTMSQMEREDALEKLSRNHPDFNSGQLSNWLESRLAETT
jgi:hypothetical protein